MCAYDSPASSPNFLVWGTWIISVPGWGEGVGSKGRWSEDAQQANPAKMPSACVEKNYPFLLALLRTLPPRNLTYSTKLLPPLGPRRRELPLLQLCLNEAQELKRPFPNFKEKPHLSSPSQLVSWGKMVSLNSHHFQRGSKEFLEREEVLEGQDIYKQIYEQLEITTQRTDSTIIWGGTHWSRVNTGNRT